MAQFPLQCLICSNDHDYSDMSHLLTHISSKGHLAAQFNASVRGSLDLALAQKLEQYNQWYRENNLAELLAKRISRKEEKKTGTTIPKTRTGRTRGKRAGKGSRSTHREQRSRDDTNEDGNNTSMGAFPIDPAIVLRREIDVDASRDLPAFTSNTDREIYHGTFDARLLPSEQDQGRQRWPLAQSHIQGISDERQDSSYSWAAGADTIHQNPANGAYFGLGTSSEPRVGTPQVQEAHRIPQAVNESEEEPNIEDGSISSKLKGTIWPGMNLFDAASPDGKRMRNQRKNYEVVSTLESISETIQPTEVIYYSGTWEFKEDRVINGEVQSPTPLDVLSPRKRRKRGPLSQKNPNQKIGKLVSEKNTSVNDNTKIKQEVEDDESLFQEHIHKRPTAYTWANTRSYNDISPSHGSPQFDVFRENPRPQSSRPISEYFNNSDYGFIRSGRPAGYSSRQIDRYQPDHLSYLTSRHVNQHRLDSGLQRSVARAELPSRRSHAPSSYEPLSNSNNYPPPQIPSNSLFTNLSIPPLGTFEHPRSILHRQETNDKSVDSSTSTLTRLLGGQGYDSHRRHEIQRGFLLGMDVPITPTRAGRQPGQPHSRYRDPFEESSGDETIDQGIDDSPISNRTRSALRGLNEG